MADCRHAGSALVNRMPPFYIHRMSVFVIILMACSLLLVLGTLFGGLVSMARSGPGAPRRSNKLMRYRVLFQFVAVVLFMIALAISR
ncbi:twin transmembrane helix small protein [Nisaea sp.]|uniref:twin transmembrane helix small protein n=1 Tax=Nisaea sp. TaxID=2024842 RepID=UPI0032EBB80A